jgi:hypothetical protein
MNGPSASPDEMPGFPFPRRPAGKLDDSLLDALLTGQSLRPDAPEQARMVADMLASLADAAGPGALAGEAAARSAFARAASPAGLLPGRRPSVRRRRRWLPAPLSARVAAALLAAVAVLGGVAAAYAGVLPGPIQNLAHQAIGAPAAHRPPSRPASARSRAAQLCAGYQRAKTRSGRRAIAAEFAKLAKAAGGAGKIDGYCTAAQAPGAWQAGRAAHQRGRSGKAVSRGKAKARGNTNAHHKPTEHRKPKGRARPSHPAHPAHPQAHGRPQ